MSLFAKMTMMRAFSSQANRTPMFVYGKLLKGFEKHLNFKMEKQVYRGKAASVQKGVMQCDDHPFIYFKEDQQLYQIRGELYDVDDECLKAVDIQKRIPDHYERKEIEVRITENPEGQAIAEKDQQVVKAYVYTREPKHNIIHDGDFIRYNKEHDLFKTV